MALNPVKPIGETPEKSTSTNPEMAQTNPTPTLDTEKKDIKDLKQKIDISELRKKSVPEIINYVKAWPKEYVETKETEQVKALLGERLLKEPSYIPEAVKVFGIDDVRDDIIWPYISSTEGFYTKFKDDYKNASLESELASKPPKERYLWKRAAVFKNIVLTKFKINEDDFKKYYVKELYNGDELRLGENLDDKIKADTMVQEELPKIEEVIQNISDPKTSKESVKQLFMREGLYGGLRDLAFYKTKMGYGNAKYFATFATLAVMIAAVYKAYKGKKLGKLLFGAAIGHFALAGATGYGGLEHLKRGLFGGYDEIIDKNRSLYAKMKDGKAEGGEADQYELVRRDTRRTEELIKKAEADGSIEVINIGSSLGYVSFLFDQKATYGDIKKYTSSNGKKIDFNLDKYLGDLRAEGRNEQADTIEQKIQESGGKDKFAKHVVEALALMGITPETYDKIPDNKSIITIGAEAMEAANAKKQGKPEARGSSGSREAEKQPLNLGKGVDALAESNTQYHIKNGKAFLVGPDGEKPIMDVNVDTSAQKMEKLVQTNPKMYLSVIAGQIMSTYYQSQADGMFFKWTGLRADDKYKGKAKAIMTTINEMVNNPEKVNFDPTVFSQLLFDGDAEKARDFRAAAFDGTESLADKKIKMISFFRDKYNVPFVIGGFLEKEILTHSEFKDVDILLKDEAFVEKLVSDHLDVLNGENKDNLYKKFMDIGLTKSQVDAFLKKVTQIKNSIDTMKEKDKNKVVETMKSKGFQGSNSDIFKVYVEAQKHMGIKMLLRSTVLEGVIENKTELKNDKLVNLYSDVKGIGFWDMSDESKSELLDTLFWDMILLIPSFATGVGAMYTGSKALELIGAARYLNRLKRVGEGFAFYEGNQFMTNVFMAENGIDLIHGMNPLNKDNALEIGKTITFFATIGLCNKLFGRIGFTDIMSKTNLGKAGEILGEVLAQSGMLVGTGALVDFVFTGEHNWTYQEFVQAIMLTGMLYKAGKIGPEARVEVERSPLGEIKLNIVERVKGVWSGIKNKTRNIVAPKEVRAYKAEFQDLLKNPEKDFAEIRSKTNPEELETRRSEYNEILEEYINKYPEAENLGSTFDLKLKYDEYLQALKSGDPKQISATKSKVELSYKRWIKMLGNEGLLFDVADGPVTAKGLKKDFGSLLTDIENGGKDYVSLMKTDLEAKFENHLDSVSGSADAIGSRFDLKTKYDKYLAEIETGNETNIKLARKELDAAHKKWIEELNKNNYISTDGALGEGTKKNIEKELDNKILALENGGKAFVDANNYALKIEFEKYVHDRFPEAETYPSTTNLIKKYTEYLEAIKTGDAEKTKSANKELKTAHEERIKELTENNLLKIEGTSKFSDYLSNPLSLLGKSGELKKQMKNIVEDIFNGGKSHVEAKYDILQGKVKEHINQFPGCETRSRTAILEIKYTQYLEAIKTGDAEKVKTAKKDLYAAHEDWIKDLKKQGLWDKKDGEKKDVKKDLANDMDSFLSDIENATPEILAANKAKYITDFQAKIDKFPEGKPYATSTELETKFNEFLTKKEAGEDVTSLKNEINKLYERRIKKLIDDKIIKLEDIEIREGLTHPEERKLRSKFVKFMDKAFSNIILDRKQIFEIFKEINVFKQGTKGIKNLVNFVLSGDPKYKFFAEGRDWKGMIYKSAFFVGVTGADLIYPFYTGEKIDRGKWGLDVLGYGMLNKLMFLTYLYRDVAIDSDSNFGATILYTTTREVVDLFGQETGANLVNFLSHILPAKDINKLRRGLGIEKGKSGLSQSGRGESALI